MGLDGVELVMAIEEAFAIQIDDEEATRIRTPRQFYEVVSRKLRAVDANVCLAQRAFYLLRRTMRHEHPIPRSAFRPDTQLDALFPKENRRKRWQELRDALGAIAWPRLNLSAATTRKVSISMFCVWLLTTGWTVWAFPAFTLYAVIGTSVLTLIVADITYRRLEPLRDSLEGQTVGTLAQHLVTFSPHLLGPASDTWTTERIRLVTRRIIVEQLGIDPNFDDDADFIDDLGVG